MMMMHATENTPPVTGTQGKQPNATKAVIIELNTIAEGRKKTDHVFLNWWLGTFVLSWVTLFLYSGYRYYRHIHRQDKHLARTKAFYTTLPDAIHALAKDMGTRMVDDSLREYNAVLLNKNTQTLFKPIHWWMPLTISLAASLFQHFGVPLLVGMAFPSADPNTTMLYNSVGQLAVAIPNLIYQLTVVKDLMQRVAKIEALQQNLLKKTRGMLADLGITNAKNIEYESQCKSRNFWLHLVLWVCTGGLGYFYTDYRIITDIEKRFTEEAKLEHQLVQALKQCYNKMQQHAKELHKHEGVMPTLSELKAATSGVAPAPQPPIEEEPS